jgi:hypothetical protein
LKDGAPPPEIIYQQAPALVQNNDTWQPKTSETKSKPPGRFVFDTMKEENKIEENKYE